MCGSRRLEPVMCAGSPVLATVGSGCPGDGEEWQGDNSLSSSSSSSPSPAYDRTDLSAKDTVVNSSGSSGARTVAGASATVSSGLGLSLSSSSTKIVVCQEVFNDLTPKPTYEEILEYALKIGIDPAKDPADLLCIAEEGIQEKLPADWKPCWHGAVSDFYYFNVRTGASQWHHPLDEVYRQRVAQAKQGRSAAPPASAMESLNSKKLAPLPPLAKIGPAKLSPLPPLKGASTGSFLKQGNGVEPPPKASVCQSSGAGKPATVQSAGSQEPSVRGILRRPPSAVPAGAEANVRGQQRASLIEKDEKRIHFRDDATDLRIESDETLGSEDESLAGSYDSEAPSEDDKVAVVSDLSKRPKGPDFMERHRLFDAEDLMPAAGGLDKMSGSDPGSPDEEGSSSSPSSTASKRNSDSHGNSSKHSNMRADNFPKAASRALPVTLRNQQTVSGSYMAKEGPSSPVHAQARRPSNRTIMTSLQPLSRSESSTSSDHESLDEHKLLRTLKFSEDVLKQMNAKRQQLFESRNSKPDKENLSQDPLPEVEDTPEDHPETIDLREERKIDDKEEEQQQQQTQLLQVQGSGRCQGASQDSEEIESIKSQLLPEAEIRANSEAENPQSVSGTGSQESPLEVGHGEAKSSGDPLESEDLPPGEEELSPQGPPPISDDQTQETTNAGPKPPSEEDRQIEVPRPENNPGHHDAVEEAPGKIPCQPAEKSGQSPATPEEVDTLKDIEEQKLVPCDDGIEKDTIDKYKMEIASELNQLRSRLQEDMKEQKKLLREVFESDLEAFRSSLEDQINRLKDDLTSRLHSQLESELKGLMATKISAAAEGVAAVHDTRSKRSSVACQTIDSKIGALAEVSRTRDLLNQNLEEIEMDIRTLRRQMNQAAAPLSGDDPYSVTSMSELDSDDSVASFTPRNAGHNVVFGSRFSNIEDHLEPYNFNPSRPLRRGDHEGTLDNELEQGLNMAGISMHTVIERLAALERALNPARASGHRDFSPAPSAPGQLRFSNQGNPSNVGHRRVLPNATIESRVVPWTADEQLLRSKQWLQQRNLWMLNRPS